MQVTISIKLSNPETAAEDFSTALIDLAENVSEFGLDDTDLASITGHVAGQMKVEDI